jgi:hypothetical protein
MSDVNGTGMDAPSNNSSSGAVTSAEATRKNPNQGKFKSGIGQKSTVKIDTNKHGIRREVTPKAPAKRTGRSKKI